MEVVYDEGRWELLNRLRSGVAEMMRALMTGGFECIVYGSIARGDVDKDSDLDIFIPYPASTIILELHLASKGIRVSNRVFVQATPSYVPKAYLVIDEKTTISLPLMKTRREEMGFYKLAGSITLKELEEDVRVPGINKELKLIMPTSFGHIELPVERNIEEASSILGIDPKILRNRIKVLRKRIEKGRTGVYREIEVPKEKTIEQVLEELMSRDPALRRRFRAIG